MRFFSSKMRQRQDIALAASLTPMRQALRRLRHNRAAMSALIFLLLLIAVCLAGPWFSSWQLDTTNALQSRQAPSMDHWLGTDFLGRDVLTRLMYAGRISLTVGLISVVLSVALGFVAGALSGYCGGWIDSLIMRVADLLMTIPSLPLLIALGALLSELKIEPEIRIYMVMLMLSLIGWPGLARMVRGQILSLRERDFMLATEVLGLSLRRRLFGHLLPNTVPILLVVATTGVAGAILGEASLSYLGLGVVPPTPSWGNMMDSANSFIDFKRRPWLWMPPGMAIFLTVIAINVLGDGMRDALDPKS
ncbi:oligopeptide ABC transporter permease [Uliginosibacterium gangwonense]|uniref:oligopeptide ABC transporter permease n=1 Tax=Uliginosibacterium gangwonense TaxID=392736 RepID=UPI00035C491E|nr:oligopeptide ABC transporter permease [Uliginosibacterium gangwonense]